MSGFEKTLAPHRPVLLQTKDPCYTPLIARSLALER